MKLREAIDAYRFDAVDTAAPPFVEDPKLIKLFSEAQIEACRRARLIVDSTSSLARVDFAAGDELIPISPLVISIKRARLESVSKPLSWATAREMDACFPGWDTNTTRSTPFVLVADYETDALRHYPLPKVDDCLLMTIAREPEDEIASVNDEFEINARYHRGLVEWVKYRVFGSSDTDLYDAKKSQDALGAFVAEFGVAPGAINERFEFANYHDVGEM